MKPQSTTETSPLQWGETFRDGSRRMVGNDQLRANLRNATETIRSKRDARAAEAASICLDLRAAEP